MKNTWHWAALWLVCASFQPSGKVYFRNPSFEDTPRASASPVGWYSVTPGSTPDIMPGAWGINFMPQEGNTCIGLVTRSENTTENIAQALASPLEGGVCYTFNMYLAHAESYVKFDSPCRLRIWGSATKNDKGKLLASSPLINHTDWRNYKFQFFTSGEVRYITMEAWYAPGVTFKYNGNIMLDHCSPIERCDRA
ncbi:MAG: hypothetical protein JNJ57_10545 [Saprospiraceae bacterium]|nr:hypothetical protein [Saprospiraceae bacterium]